MGKEKETYSRAGSRQITINFPELEGNIKYPRQIFNNLVGFGIPSTAHSALVPFSEEYYSSAAASSSDSLSSAIYMHAGLVNILGNTRNKDEADSIRNIFSGLNTASGAALTLGFGKTKIHDSDLLFSYISGHDSKEYREPSNLVKFLVNQGFKSDYISRKQRVWARNGFGYFLGNENKKHILELVDRNSLDFFAELCLRNYIPIDEDYGTGLILPKDSPKSTSHERAKQNEVLGYVPTWIHRLRKKNIREIIRLSENLSTKFT